MKIISQSGMELVFSEQCRSIYTVVNDNGSKVIYASTGDTKGIKLGSYKKLDHVQALVRMIADCNSDVFEMPREDAEWLNVSVRGSGAAKAKHRNSRHGGS